MEQEILRSFIAKLICLTFLFISVGSLHAQNSGQKNKDKDNKKTETVYFPLYNGLTVSADLYGVGEKMFGGDLLSSEIAVEANLKNRFLPVLELGYGTTNNRSEKGIHYKSSAPYFRIGLNYNTMYKKGKPNFLYVGLRYGFTTFSYNISNISVEDNIFGENIENPSLIDNIWGGDVPFNHTGLKSSMHWYEFLVGVRTKVYKNFYMGWTIRMKYRLSASLNKYGDPWYVPGFGKYDSSQFGLTYSLIYKLPF